MRPTPRKATPIVSLSIIGCYWFVLTGATAAPVVFCSSCAASAFGQSHLELQKSLASFTRSLLSMVKDQGGVREQSVFRIYCFLKWIGNAWIVKVNRYIHSSSVYCRLGMNLFESREKS